MKLGIFGGTFNPPHIGHLIVAERVREEMELDRIIFIPSYISPHKHEGEEHLAHHRFEMTRLTVEEDQNIECLDVELKKGGTSFTVGTLEYLHSEHPDHELYLMIGMDNYHTFHTWKDPERILELATLVVMNRPNFQPKLNPHIKSSKISFATVPHIDISSTDIRKRVLRGESIRYLVTEKVRLYIAKQNLYK
ncbi:MAG: nicotinate-nucleotide adenylyltransferase [Bacteroidota bacterium]|nr:nicotinate-nucleotide adenylyltransferase [Bacteroidota bacterium]